MNELTAPIIRFRHAAEAIGVTKKTLRNWLARGQVELDTPSEGWATFSRLDLVRLALTAELVKFGVGILPAFMTARSHVTGACGLLASYRNTPAGVLEHAFKGYRLYVQQPSDGRWIFNHAKPMTELAPEDIEGSSILTIDTQSLANAVFDRLIEALNDEDYEPDSEVSE